MASGGKFNLDDLDLPSEDEKRAAKEALDAESDEIRKVKLKIVNEEAKKRLEKIGVTDFIGSMVIRPEGTLHKSIVGDHQVYQYDLRTCSVHQIIHDGQVVKGPNLLFGLN